MKNDIFEKIGIILATGRPCSTEGCPYVNICQACTRQADRIAEELRREVARERERCAEIADEHKQEMKDVARENAKHGDDELASTFEECALRLGTVAEFIRKRGTKNGRSE